MSSTAPARCSHFVAKSKLVGQKLSFTVNERLLREYQDAFGNARALGCCLGAGLNANLSDRLCALWPAAIGLIADISDTLAT